MGLIELVVQVHDAFESASLSHGFGGALALAHAAEPRGTRDIDVNVFVRPSGFDRVVAALEPVGYVPPDDVIHGFAGIRFRHRIEPVPLDVFTAVHEETYAEIDRRRVFHRFADTDRVLPFVSPEDLCVFKLSFGRPQDWVDLQAIALARPDLDVDYIERVLVELRGKSMYPRVARFRTYLR